MYDDVFSPLAAADKQGPDEFPMLSNLSAAFFYQFVPILHKSNALPEFIGVPLRGDTKRDLGLYGAIASWNMMWEAGVIRFEMLETSKRWMDGFQGLDWIKAYRDRNVDLRLIPLDRSCRYNVYAPIYHLLPVRILKQFGLPALKQGLWPGGPDPFYIAEVLPRDFEARLGNALASLVWPCLCSGTPLSGFSKSDPLVLLAHSLDFWLPYIDVVIQERMTIGRVKVEDRKQAALMKSMQKKCAPEVTIARPLFGGAAWMGESDAADATVEMIELADKRGQLRSIIDSIRSNRVEEDFSPVWSYAREDFERKLYRKRDKIRIQFVQLDDTIPTHGPETEVIESRFWQSFLAVLNPKERRIVICLRNGVTRLADIGEIMGYANHTAISKALKKVREKANRLLS